MTLADLRRYLQNARLTLTRRLFARGQLRGRGIEIGALDAPFKVPRGASVRYLDRMTVEELRHHYPELRDRHLVEVDLVDDGERLATVPSASQDFVIASHVLEHCEDPLAALGHWMRVLRPGGKALLIVPDRRFTFDRERQPTTLEHLVRDHQQGPEVSRRQHYREWAEDVEGFTAEKAAERAVELESSHYSIHFHTWDDQGLAELLQHHARSCETGSVVLKARRNRNENLALLERRPPSARRHRDS